MSAARPFITRHRRLLALSVLLLAYGLLVSSALRKSATVDEQSHLFRGVAYLRGGATQFLLGHPLGASALSALPLLTEPDLRLPLDTPAWQDGDWSVAGDAFFWRLGNNPLRMLFLGRLPVIWLTLLLLALGYRWARELAGRGAALAALLLLAFDPNLLAHGRIVSGDMAVTFFMLLTLYGYWRWSGSGARRHLLLAGLGLGLASVSKYNAALLLPMLGLQGLWLARRRRRWAPLTALLGVGALGALVIWLVYGLALRPLPGGAFWDDLFWQLRYFDQPHGAYLLGEYSTTGWWYYFPVAFLLKTPLPLLLLLAGALLLPLVKRQGARRPALFLLLPPLLYFGASLTSGANIGYRYLLPMLPFLWLYVAVTFAGGPRVARPALAAAGLWLLLQALVIWPDYIPFFNRLAGGPARDWQVLSDSNIDWGQDLPALAAWQAADGRPLKLSYFGTAHPSAYGVVFDPLPMWPPAPEQAAPGFQAYDPLHPAPGVYAISVTSLHGVVLGGQAAAFAPFRDQAPLARLGQSIFLYEVAAAGPPLPIALAGVEPAALPPAVRAALGSNDLRIRWLRGPGALLWPAGGGLLALGEARDPLLQPYLDDGAQLMEADGVRLFRLAAAPALPDIAAAPFGEFLTLRGVALVTRRPAPGGEMTLLSGWETGAGSERPLQIFVHLVDASGAIVAQWDGLGALPGSWQAGDFLLQSHRIAVPAGSEARRLVIGVYDGATLERLGAPLTVPLRP